MDCSDNIFGFDYHPYHPDLRSIMHDLDRHVMRRNLTQNTLKFASTGDVTAMQRVFADQASMVRQVCHHVVLTDACPIAQSSLSFPGG